MVNLYLWCLYIYIYIYNYINCSFSQTSLYLMMIYKYMLYVSSYSIYFLLCIIKLHL